MGDSSGPSTIIRLLLSILLGGGLAYGVGILLGTGIEEPAASLRAPLGRASLALLGFGVVIIGWESIRLMRAWLSRKRGDVRYTIDQHWDAWCHENPSCLTSQVQDAAATHRQDAEAMTTGRWRPYYFILMMAPFPIFVSRLNEQTLDATNAYLPWNSHENPLLWVTGGVLLLFVGLWLLRLGWSGIWQTWEQQRVVEWSEHRKGRRVLPPAEIGTVIDNAKSTEAVVQAQTVNEPVTDAPAPVAKKLHFKPTPQQPMKNEPQDFDDPVFEEPTPEDD